MVVAIATTQEAAKGGATRQRCRHHWIIEDPRDRKSEGMCKLCGAHKEFMNYLRDCLEADGEEYEAWLSRQKDYVRESEMAEKAVEQVGGKS
jgi:hypothetical protein